MDEVDNIAATATTSEKRVRRDYRRAVVRYGEAQVHDISCRTWRGMNWVGACDCFLADRLARTPNYRVSVFGPCDLNATHQPHVFQFGTAVDPDGTIVAQRCPGKE